MAPRSELHSQTKDPLHGITLETIVTSLVEKYGWKTLSVKIDINCFKKDPSIKSSLKFLRKTPWAREKVEQLYLSSKSLSSQKISSQKIKNSNKSSNTNEHGLINEQVWGSTLKIQVK